METYKVDSSGKHVKLEVLLVTAGSGYTRVYLNFTTKDSLLFESDSNHNGVIPSTKVGINRKLKFNSLIIVSILNFSNIPADQQDSAINSTRVIYTLDGGPDGKSIYEKQDSEVDKTNPKRVIITKTIDFV